jgi:enterochelin esterase-like enzyme
MNNLSNNIHRLKPVSGLLFVLFIHIAPVVQGSILENHSFQSKILHKTMHYSVLLPDNYFNNQQKYPIVYLLHGYGGDRESWIVRCKVNSLIDSLKSKNLVSDFIYIMPDAQNSYYINNYDSTFRYEDYFIKEFIPHLDSVYRTLLNPENHILLGFSMGGFGAAILGARHPDIFGSIVILCGSLRDSTIFVNMPQDTYEKLFGNVFGHGLKGEARITRHWKQNSPYYYIDSVSAIPLRKMNLYLDCGLSDQLLPANEVFHQLLLKSEIPHEFHVRQGDHNLEYWYRSTTMALIYITSLQINVLKKNSIH